MTLFRPNLAKFRPWFGYLEFFDLATLFEFEPLQFTAHTTGRGTVAAVACCQHSLHSPQCSCALPALSNGLKWLRQKKNYHKLSLPSIPSASIQSDQSSKGSASKESTNYLWGVDVYHLTDVRHLINSNILRRWRTKLSSQRHISITRRRRGLCPSRKYNLQSEWKPLHPPPRSPPGCNTNRRTNCRQPCWYFSNTAYSTWVTNRNCRF